MNKYSKLDKTVVCINYIVLALIVLIIIVPLAYVLVASFMDPSQLLSHGISFNPKDWTVEGYGKIFQDSSLVRGFINSFIYSTLFTLISVSVTICAAYPLSLQSFIGRKAINMLFVITMFFGGGLIPTYLLVKDLNMLDTIWSILLPGCINVWNIILARTFLQSIPNELNEAAMVDGANSFTIFYKIILPLSKPIIFVLALYCFVGQWNSFFDAMIYLKTDLLYPLQLVLRRILIQNQPLPGMIGDQMAMIEMKRISEIIKYSAIVISSLPLLLMYPFFQKYFEKGVMVGSIKG